MGSPCTAAREKYLLATTGQKPKAALKTQHRREKKKKTTMMRYYLTLVSMTIIKNSTNNKS